MDPQNIDRFFREKLDKMEVNPSPEAWSQVEKQIHIKKTTAFYWVAASITLIFVSWLVWPDQSVMNQPLISGEIDHPVLESNEKLNAPIAAKLNPEKVVKPSLVKQNKPSQSTPIVQVAAIQVKEPIQEDLVEILPEVENEKAIAFEGELDHPDKSEDLIMTDQSTEVVDPKTEIDYSAVKITYIASKSSKSNVTMAQKNDSTGVLKKFIAFAEKIDPGEMLADMKTAKDNLLNGGLKNKKEKGTLNP